MVSGCLSLGLCWDCLNGGIEAFVSVLGVASDMLADGSSLDRAVQSASSPDERQR